MAAGEGHVLSVLEAVRSAKEAVGTWPQVVVEGEVTGFKQAQSGHWFFSLRDPEHADVSLSCKMWSFNARRQGFVPENGFNVRLTGTFDVYLQERRGTCRGDGSLSLIASSAALVVDEGVLRRQVAELTRKLAAEGLTAPERKRPIPRLCSRICVVTSTTGAVLGDVCSTLGRRNPLVRIDVVAATVQGADAPASLIRGLSLAAATGPDAILLVRGGGSYEERMCFNDEALARAIAACPVPVVTGIGHQPDSSIADLVADRACENPTAAAESVSPASEELTAFLGQSLERMGNAVARLVAAGRADVDALGQQGASAMRGDLRHRRVRLDALATRPCLRDPGLPVRRRREDVERLSRTLAGALPALTAAKRGVVEEQGSRLMRAGGRISQPGHAELRRLAASLEALSPLRVLARGYAIATDSGGHVVSSARALSAGDALDVRLGEGSVRTEVKEVVDG